MLSCNRLHKMSPPTRVHTIADIARLAGVSKSTVSRALSDSPRIGAETKERIRAIADEHRFQLNDPARRLGRKQSNVAGLVTYASAAAGIPAGDPFLFELLSGISARLQREAYDLLIIQSGPRDVDWVGRYLDSGRVDGFIVLAATCTQRQLDALAEAQAPFVVWGMPAVHGTFSSVSGDSLAGGRLATEHLLAESGRSRIAFLGGPEREPEAAARYRGYEAALRTAGVEVDPALVTFAEWKPASAAPAIRTLLDRAPDLDAVFACSDLLAIAAIQELREHGRTVPSDVAVVGYDDIAAAELASPPLTTIRQDLPLAGRLLAESLLEHLRTRAVTSVSIPPELIVRESA